MEQEEYFRSFIKNAMELAIFFDQTGKILYLNPTATRLLEYGIEAEHLNIKDVFPMEFPEETAVSVQVKKYAEEIKSLTAYRKNKTCFPIKGKFISNPELQNVFACLGLDETDRTFYQKKANRADEEAKEANKVKTEFVATITHELRTPVNGILANTKDLLERESDEDKRYILQMMERGCRDMGGLINNILDFSKLEAGKFVLEKREFNFRAMMDYVKTNHQKKITEKGLDFFVTVSTEVPETVVGDELRIVQILNNLISNATKFTDIGKVSVEVLKTAQMDTRVELFFFVVDTGIGIAKEQQDKLFKSFSQVDASISRRFGGTGLGLNISKQLVELMDGTIHVESEAQKGSIFSFCIWVDTVKPKEEMKPYVPELTQVQPEKTQPEEVKDLPPIWVFRTKENQAEIQQKSDKLILCIELRNYEKAEMFADTLKKLCNTAPPEIRQATLRLKMAVQKADYDKSVSAYEEWSTLYGRTEEE